MRIYGESWEEECAYVGFTIGWGVEAYGTSNFHQL